MAPGPPQGSPPRGPAPDAPPPRRGPLNPPIPAGCSDKRNITITPPRLQKIDLDIQPVTDSICPGSASGGKFTFQAIATEDITEDQAKGIAAKIRGAATNAQAANCTGPATAIPAGTAFNLECAGLPADTLTLDVAIPNTQQPGELPTRARQHRAQACQRPALAAPSPHPLRLCNWTHTACRKGLLPAARSLLTAWHRWPAPRPSSSPRL
jgi:hypothetical protein